MSVELEVLDQLLGGDLPIEIVRGLFPDRRHFLSGILGLLHSGEVRLLTADGAEVPKWNWQHMLSLNQTDKIGIRITAAGAQRIS